MTFKINNKGASTLILVLVLASVMATSAFFFSNKIKLSWEGISKNQSKVSIDNLKKEIAIIFTRDQNCSASLADLTYRPNPSGEIEVVTGYGAAIFHPQMIYENGKNIGIWTGNLDGVRTRKKMSSVEIGTDNPPGQNTQSHYCSQPDGSLRECVDESGKYKKVVIDRVYFLPITPIEFSPGELVTQVELIEIRVQAREYLSNNNYIPITEDDNNYFSFKYGPIWIKKVSDESVMVIGCGHIGTSDIPRHTWGCVNNTWTPNVNDTCANSDPSCSMPGNYSGPFPICCSSQQPSPSPICGPADFDLYTCNGATAEWDQAEICPAAVVEGVGCNTNDPAVGGDRLCCTSAPSPSRCNAAGDYNLFLCEYTAPNSVWTFVPPGGCDPSTSSNTDCSSSSNLISGESACCAVAATDAGTIQATCSQAPCNEGQVCASSAECGNGNCTGLVTASCVGVPAANLGGTCSRKPGTICDVGTCDEHVDPGMGFDCSGHSGANQNVCESTAVWISPTQKQFCRWRRNMSFLPSCSTYADSPSCNAISGCNWQPAGVSVCSCSNTPEGECLQDSPCSSVNECGGAPNLCSSSNVTGDRYTYANARTYNRTGLDHLICLEPEESVNAPSIRDALDEIFNNNSFTTGSGNPAMVNPGSNLQERFVKSIMVAAGVIPGLGTVNDDTIRAAQVMGTSSSFNSPPECLAAAGWDGPITEYLYTDGDLYSSRRTGPQYLVNKPDGAGGYAVAYQLFIAGPFSGAGDSTCQCVTPPSDGHWFVCGADGDWKMGPSGGSNIPATPANLIPAHSCSGSTDPIHNDAGNGGYNFSPGDMRCWNAIPSNCSCFTDPNNPAENC